MIDYAALARIARDLYTRVIHVEFGDPGTASLRTLLDALTQLYQHLNPELLTQRLTLYCRVPGLQTIDPNGGELAGQTLVFVVEIVDTASATGE